ncbi:MAG: hypothetical protein ACOY4H_13580 [Thermodesulfobacteriota bacterium]
MFWNKICFFVTTRRPQRRLFGRCLASLRMRTGTGYSNDKWVIITPYRVKKQGRFCETSRPGTQRFSSCGWPAEAEGEKGGGGFFLCGK